MADQGATFPARTIAECNALLTSPAARFAAEEVVIGGVPLRAYKNATTFRALIQQSREWGEKEFFLYQHERVTFAAHFKAVAHLATRLANDYGVKKGDRVAICMRNYPQWPVALFATLSLGAIATPLNAWWSGEELEYGLSDSGAKVAIVDLEKLERIREHLPNLPQLRHVLVTRGGDEEADPRIVALDALIGGANDWAALPDISLPDADVQPDDDATIFYTSGTTGKPKGALATNRACISGAFNSATCQARHFLRSGEPVPVRDPKGGPQRVALLAIPLFHVTGAFSWLLPAVINADKIITMYKWDVVDALGVIQREKVTTIGGVPAIAWQVLEHPDRDNYDLSSIGFVSYGGAPSAPELLATIKRRFPSSLSSNGWGMTETCAAVCVNFGRDYEVRPESCGAAAPVAEFRIVGANGEALPPGGVGEVWTRGPSNCKLYWNKPEATAKTFIDGWVVTGDIGKVDEEGFLYLLDRAKDMLIRGGENVYCVEVENVLYEHPAVMDAAVVGIPHKVLGEEVGAVVQLKPETSATPTELRQFVAERLAAFKTPVEVQVRNEPLPRNANGKILKNELRPLFTPRG